MSLPLQVIDAGRMSYSDAWDMQRRLLAQRQAGEIPDTLILVEHPPVLTLGKRGGREDILLSEQELIEKGVEVFPIERGGLVTYHGPGQIVGYTIIDLNHHNGSIKRFVEGLENTFVDLLKSEFGIDAFGDTSARGVWIGKSKITAIGIAVKKRVTMHGFAFNVNTDLSHFNWIVPCGLADRSVTSLQTLTSRSQDLNQIKKHIIHYFCKEFHYELTK